MDTQLPAYSDHQPCAKCHHTDASTEYRCGILRLLWVGDHQQTITADGYARECLLRTCQNCGWGWLEACADTTPEAQPRAPQ